MENNSHVMLKLSMNKLIINFLSFISIISFLLANIIIFNIFIHFIKVEINKILLFIICFGISIILIKPHWLIDIKFPRIKTYKNKHLIKEDFRQIINFKNKIKINSFNIMIIILRLLFFNTLNDLFMILIVWSGIFIILYLFFDIITITSENIQNMINILTILGILLGIFQFYIKSYKEQVYQKTINKIANCINEIIKNITFSDFLIFIENKDKKLYHKLMNISNKDPVYPYLKLFRDMRSKNKPTNVIFNIYSNNIIIDEILELSLEKKDKEKLKQYYEKFFNEKRLEIKQKIDMIDVTELRKLFLPNIILFDEIFAELTNLIYFSEYEKYKKEPETYQEFLQFMFYEMTSYFINRIVGVEDEI